MRGVMRRVSQGPDKKSDCLAGDPAHVPKVRVEVGRNGQFH